MCKPLSDRFKELQSWKPDFFVTFESESLV